MAPPKRKQQTSSDSSSHGEPKFPYTNTPSSLRRFLSEVPNRPKPPKVTTAVLKSWGLKDSNAYTILRVLKAIGLLTSDGVPTNDYVLYMEQGSGPRVLAGLLRNAYSKLFESTHTPHKEDDKKLKNLFNVHSGGSESTMGYQVATFKALAEHADFAAGPSPSVSASSAQGEQTRRTEDSTNANSKRPHVHIDLHIHLPPNKSTRDYAAMFEDIGRFIYGRTDGEQES